MSCVGVLMDSGDVFISAQNAADAALSADDTSARPRFRLASINQSVN